MACYVPGCTASSDLVLCAAHWQMVPQPLRQEYEAAWQAAHGWRRFGLTGRGYLAIQRCIASALILTGHKLVEDVMHAEPLWVEAAAEYDVSRAMAQNAKKAPIPP